MALARHCKVALQTMGNLEDLQWLKVSFMGMFASVLKKYVILMTSVTRDQTMEIVTVVCRDAVILTYEKNYFPSTWDSSHKASSFINKKGSLCLSGSP